MLHKDSKATLVHLCFHIRASAQNEESMFRF